MAIVVGVDGSRGSRAALDWALVQADLTGPAELLHPVMAWRSPWWTPTGPRPSDESAPDAELGRALDDALQGIDPQRYADPVVARGRAGPILVEAATAATMLVVGSRGRSAFVGSLLGSTSSYCVAHSTVPAVVVPDFAKARNSAERVLVGIDGSDNSRRALQWALEAFPGRPVIALHAWSPPASDVDFGSAIPQMERTATDLLDRTIVRALEGGADPSRIEKRVELADPREALRTPDGDLLVIGARGGGRLDRLLVGSTASAMTHEPLVPTVIVPRHL